MKRIQSVDVLRVFGIISVIVIHTVPFAKSAKQIGERFDLATLIQLPAHFAVPFFFILSGYFWAKKFENEQEIYTPTIALLKRVGFLFFIWSVIYLLPLNIFYMFDYGPLGPVKQIYWSMTNAMARPLDTMMQGTREHLWFLMALLWSISISAILLRYRQTRLLLFVAIALYFIGLAGKAYSDSPLGFSVDFNFRNGPFFSLIFFVTGYFLYLKKAKPAWFPIGLSIAAVGLFLQFAELSALKQQWGTSLGQDYVIGTYFLGLGAAMMGLSDSRYLCFPSAAAIGPLVLGIYASHCLIIDFLRPLNSQFAGNWIWSVAHVAIVFSLSYALVKFMVRFKFTRKLVM